MTALFGQKHHEYRVRYKAAGGHIHCRVFSRPHGQETWAKCGDLTISATEMASFQAAFKSADFLEEDF
jgi:hypothetical protein